MAIPSSSDTVIANLNAIITTLIVERDRLNVLFKNSLPGNYAIWSVISEDVRTSVISDCSTKLTTASTTLSDTIDSVGAL